ncbi:glycosyltransferase [Clostridium sp. D2Q-11]|uniref:Glycosyltransferase n=1 Tax=Anaeromonas frigoriresistens TaxID=2683708 RepID=A0A942UX19_9FIRM|nr:glycosyltransferase [Anaeromonas frigoriresistens]MBS4539140.1 glycosyltransferase [Anaeromonas frigoriresistens]
MRDDYSHRKEITTQKNVSVIIPTYKGEDYILRCLESLNNQTLDKKRYEVIIVLNGEKDNSEDLIKEFINQNQLENFILTSSEKAGASVARNVGINISKNEYITFVDDDDFVSKGYLEGMLKDAKRNSIVCSLFVDVKEDSEEVIDENYINTFILDNLGIIDNDLIKMRPLLSSVAGKLVHRDVIGDIRFRDSLKSGEDVVFFTEISKDIRNIIITDDLKVAYHRVLRSNSVSRQEVSFEFNISQRLTVIKNLNEFMFDFGKLYNREFIKLRIKAQSKFIKDYIDKFPKDKMKIIKLVQAEEKIRYFPFSYIFNDERKLVFSYCFPPYNDPSGIVAMKRISEDFFENGVISDVIQNNMENIRAIDNSLNEFAEMFIGKQIEVMTEPYFKPKFQIKYAKRAYRIAKNLNRKYNYKEIYSRVMWPGSHFAAFYYKLRKPKTHWKAEFSDPVLYREGKIRKSNRFKFIDNFWFWLECIPYIFADELVYTNENQREYMISYFPLKFLKNKILKKSVIKNQSSLENKYYKYKNNPELENNKINIGYFGSFYKNRDISSVFEVFKNLSDPIKTSFIFYVFTNNIDELKDYLTVNNLNEYVKVNSYVDYFDFLNLSSKFDVLLVNDAITKEKIGINPYLPSKYSDYKGSQSDIWAIIEEGSPLSKKTDVKYFSSVGNKESIKEVYKSIYEEFNRKRLYIETNKYLNCR